MGVLASNCCNDPHRTAYNQTGRGLFPAHSTSFMIARRAKDVFKVIVGAWKIFKVITVKQSRLIAHRHFEEDGDHLLKWGSQGETITHFCKQFFILSLHLFR